MSSEPTTQEPAKPEPCKKCGGKRMMDPPESIRAIFGDHDFVCARCDGTGIEPASQ